MSTENPNVTPEGVLVKPGQVWEDCDTRMAGRTIRVISVENGKAHVDSGYQKTTISVRRMRVNSTGYRLIKEAK